MPDSFPASRPPIDPVPFFQQSNRTIHMAGIGGVGMAGLALLLRKQGFEVSGCDAGAGPLLPWLRAQGISCVVGHDPSHLDRPPDAVVRSPAVPLSEPELLRARELAIPIFDRGQVLPVLLPRYQTVAVAGTHGKTTTAAMIAWILQYRGMKISYCIGGVCPGLGAVARAEPDGFMVVEADESDGTLQLYHSDIAVITTMDLDHVDYFQDASIQQQVFASFADQARVLVAPSGDPAAARLNPPTQTRRTFGFDSAATCRADQVMLHAHGSSFDLNIDGVPVARVEVSAPGRHNILNALAAICAAHEWGIPMKQIVEALSVFQLPQRRFETVAEGSGRRVISDYAHHPVEIEALLAQAALLKPRRMIAVYQPHRYSRTRAFRDAFVHCLKPLDYLVLAPVYSASEPMVEGGTSADLFAAFLAAGAANVACAASLEEAWARLKHEAQPDDLVLIIGAGDVERIGEWAAREWDAKAKDSL